MRSDYHGGIFGHFGALLGAPVVMYGWCTTPGQGPGRTNQEDRAGDRFQVTSFPRKMPANRDLVNLMAFLVTLGL